MVRSFKHKLRFYKQLKGLYNNPERGYFFRQKTAKIGLKACWHDEQIATRLAHNPPIIELYLYDGDLEKNLSKIENTVIKLKNKKIEVVIHQPNKYKGEEMTIAIKNERIAEKSAEGYELLNKLCEKYALLGFIMHTYSSDLYIRNHSLLNKNLFIHRLNSHKDWHSKILLENSTVGFFKTKEDMKEIAEKTGINLCIDLCHMYMTYQDNNKLEQAIKILQPYTRYFHIVDTTGAVHDSLEIGKGTIDFPRIAKYLHTGIIEVNCENQITADEMIRSYYALQKFFKKTKKLNITQKVQSPMMEQGFFKTLFKTKKEVLS